MEQPSWWRQQYGRLRTHITDIHAALRPQVHDDAKVLAAWDAEKDEDARKRSSLALEKMIERSTGSINNSYLKVQIATGLIIGLIVVFLTVFAQMPGVITWLLVTGVVMSGASIGLSLLVTTAGSAIWKEQVREPGVYTLRLTPRSENLALSRRAFHNRVVLLRNRKISWLATWLLTLPGFVLAMMSWAWIATSVALVFIVAIAWAYKRYVGGKRPRLSLHYPAS